MKIQVGSQYRSGIYYQSEAQQKIAEDSCKAVSKELGEEVVVEVKDGLDAPFYLAESYHQQYVNYIQRLAVFRCGDVENKGLTPTSDPVDCGMETIVVADISRRVGRALKKVLLRRFGVTDKVCVSIAVMRQHQPIEVHVNWKQLMGKYHLEHGTLTSSLNCAGR